MQLIEIILVREGEYVDKVLWESAKYWQTQLFTLTHGLNDINPIQDGGGRGKKAPPTSFSPATSTNVEIGP